MNKEEVSLTIGANIRKLRLSYDMSLEDLADQLGVTAGFLGLVERGVRGTHIYNLVKIANFFNKPLDYFITEGSGMCLEENEAETSYKDIQMKKYNIYFEKLSSDDLSLLTQIVQRLVKCSSNSNISEEAVR